ncbi:branched-chain amino acid ABC transporter permease [Halobellus ordinarius]|uniref:branched-chain amino acid ABC transporter permease n=1 Tax=Halobellus ordinarius TaxID=3075120 RepID=UPI002880524F|nr:branched-chain amino acid ABC transporter permease [Halobellus sp. ZY16]
MNEIPIPGTNRSTTPAAALIWGALLLLTVMSAVARPGLFIDQAVGGLVYGLVLVLIALGLSIVLGLLGIVNFAHGALFMLGAYFTFQFMEVWGVSFWATLVLAPLAVGLVGVVIERSVLRHLYNEDPLNGLLATFGIAMMLGEATRATWGGSPLSVTTPEVLDLGLNLGVTTVSRIRIFTVVVSVVVIAAVYLLIERTDFGLSVRAGVLDREMAEFLGVNMNVRFISMFVLGAAIAGLGGVLRGTAVGMELGMANQFIILAFVVVVVGGIGSLFGSVVAGILIGEASYLTPLYLQTLADATSIQAINIPGISGLVPYLVMIVVLLARPRGLFGQEGFLE